MFSCRSACARLWTVSDSWGIGGKGKRWEGAAKGRTVQQGPGKASESQAQSMGWSMGCEGTEKEKAAEISGLSIFGGGGGGIRTLEAFRLTHFPGVLLRPLGHPSALSSRET